MSDTPRGARIALVGAILLTGMLYASAWGRWIAWPLVLLSTYAHELGHGLAALAVGGHFESLQIWADGSGLARHAGPASGWARAAVGAGGLLGPAAMSALFFALAGGPRRARGGLALFGVGTLLVDLLFVRNLFGLVFVGLVGATALLFAWRASTTAAQTALAFLAAQLGLSVFSRGDYLFMEVAHTGGGTHPSDVAQISDALFGPYWLWGLAIGALSVAVLVGGMGLFLRSASAGD